MNNWITRALHNYFGVLRMANEFCHGCDVLFLLIAYFRVPKSFQF